jgi:hypothetical protein
MKYASIETWKIKLDFYKSFMKKSSVYFFISILVLNLLLFFNKNIKIYFIKLLIN